MPEFLDLHSRSSKALRALVDRAMRPHGLRYGQDLLLTALSERDGRTPGEVATALSVTTPTVTTMANRMATAGLLVRRPDEHDNRLVRLWLTGRGRQLLEPIEAERARIERRVTARLDDGELSELIRLLSIVRTSAHEALDETQQP